MTRRAFGRVDMHIQCGHAQHTCGFGSAGAGADGSPKSIGGGGDDRGRCDRNPGGLRTTEFMAIFLSSVGR